MVSKKSIKVLIIFRLTFILNKHTTSSYIKMWHTRIKRKTYQHFPQFLWFCFDCFIGVHEIPYLVAFFIQALNQ